MGFRTVCLSTEAHREVKLLSTVKSVSMASYIAKLIKMEFEKEKITYKKEKPSFQQ